MNAIERAIATISPGWAARRAKDRVVFAYYEAANSTKTRKSRRESGSGDAAVGRAGTALREQARHLEQNHDISRNALGVMVANIVGPRGIGIEPQPRRADGSIDPDLAKQILRLWRDWQRRPEVTWRHSWAAAQRLMCRSWLRDGEGLAQRLLGSVPLLDHGSRVPFSIELLEADYLPLSYSTADGRITQGIERNAWGRPVTYWVYKDHPGNVHARVSRGQLKGIPAARILHPALVDRIGQARGVTCFASVLGRLDDIKDYEESERVAAKVAASMAGYIKKGMPEAYEPEAEDGEVIPRDLKFRPGMVFDDLRPGEEIGTIDTTRPNTNLEHFRRGQLRAAAGGMGCTYSSLAKDYDGTYSSQRQELVEGWIGYGVLTDEFIGQFVQPVYEDFIAAALAAGLIRLPAGMDIDALNDALYIPPQMPWIDPQKEANAWETLEGAVHASGPEIIRKRGLSPDDVLEQEAVWRTKLSERGLLSSADPANQGAAAPAQEPDNANERNARTRRRA